MNDLTIVNESDPVIQMKLLKARENQLLRQELRRNNGITFNIEMIIEFVKDAGSDSNTTGTFNFTPKLTTITYKDEIPKARNIMYQHVNGMIDKSTNQGSGWIINRITRHFYKFKQI